MSYADFVAPPFRFRIGQRVASTRGYRGTVTEYADDAMRYLGRYDYRVVWDGSDECDGALEIDLCRASPTGIGAVVAMVAAARMLLGGWQPCARTSQVGVSHWDFVPLWAQTSHAACGNVWPGDYGSAADISDVDCPECLRMYARVHGPVTP